MDRPTDKKTPRERSGSLWMRFGAACKYWYLRVIRQAGTPEYVAGGMALGLFVNFFIPMGLQTVGALALAFLFRVAKVPALLATCVTNYATAIVIYPLQCYIGSRILFHPLSYREITEQLSELMHSDGMREAFHALLRLGFELGGAFFVGGALFGVLAAVPGYYLTKRFVIAFRAKIAARRIAKAARQKLKNEWSKV